MSDEQPDEFPTPVAEEHPDESGLITWGELAVEVAERLRGAPATTDPAREALTIVSKACGATAQEWPDAASRHATVRGVAAIDGMSARRLAGEPLQYVVGEWGFRYLDLFVDRRVLIPRPETEVVAGAALAEARRVVPDDGPVIIADLGTGSGAIGLALVTEHSGAEVWLTDASADALAVARANTAGVGRAGARVRIAQGSWFDALPADLAGQLGVIVSNPPYVADGEELPAEVVDWEPTDALFAGPMGTEDHAHLVAEAPRWLAPGGSLVLEIAPAQAPAVVELASAHFDDVVVEADLAGRDRVVVARHPRSSNGREGR